MPQIQEHRQVQDAVRAHAGWVYSCARRRVRDDALAEDVAQAVFILFWQRQAKMAGEARLTGWLYRAVKYCSANALRRKQIRQHHEKEAAMAGLQDAAGEAQWDEISPELEQAVDRLRDKDRSAVLLRFYRQMSFAEVGQSLGISKEAARKRVDRALENLRGILAKKGVTAGAAGLGAVMAANVSEAAPAGVVNAAMAAAGGGGTGSAGIIAKGAVKMMAWAKVKAAAVIAAAAFAAIGTTVIVESRAGEAAAVQTAPLPAARVQTVPVQTPATTRSTDATELLLQAARAIVVDSPASSPLTFPAYPPMGDAWTALAAQAWEANGETRDLARQARSTDRAVWPAGERMPWLAECRHLANDLADAAMYAHLQGQDSAAIELVRDDLYLAKLLRKDLPAHSVIRPLTAAGVDAVALSRLLAIVSAVQLTTDPADGKSLQIAAARQLILELLDQQSARDTLKQIMGSDDKALPPEFSQELQAFYPKVAPDLGLARAAETCNRSNAERTFAAMSLACHLFRADKNRWPKSLEEIVPAYLPRVPVDPWGDGAQTFAYVLIKGGLPDGSDRPLVYSRWESHDGLFFRIDAPQYAFYVRDTRDPAAEGKRGGQFRDVARWTPVAGRTGPTTQPLP